MIYRLNNAKSLMAVLLVCSSLFAWTPAQAVIEAVEFKDPATAQRYQDLIAELRCLVCQNQNLADSDADLAKDLRRKTAEMLKQGMSDQQILDYMRERYGDFVLYRPPFTLVTALLWIGPFMLLVLSVTLILVSVKRRHAEHKAVDDPLDGEERRKIKDLLDNSPELSNRSGAGE